MPCPDDERLAAYVELRLEESPRAAIEAHLRECESCREVVTQLAITFASGGEHEVVADSPARARGSRFGRYLVVEVLGQGAMGVVYAAYDPDLDRRVAIKVLRRDVHADPSVQLQRRQRSVREARALASISHPNVITIHDVGVVDDEVFIAMELIRGRTLAAWLRAESRSRTDVLDVLLRAGQGLWAAHAEGVVHRDFKPENVMVADDPRDVRGHPRVLVTDFGLARIDTRDDVGVLDGAATTTSELSSSETLTVAGALLGTPAYMAPEQLRGETADARSDQFSFCTVLFEALVGERPFHGVTAIALAESMRAGPPSTRGLVDRRIEAVLARGFALDPAGRFPDMAELLDALARAYARRSVRWALVVIGSTALVAATGVIASVAADRRPEPCTDAAEKIADVWNEERRGLVATSFETTPGLTADVAAGWAQQRLDEFSTGWQASYRDACAATVIDGVQTPRTMEMRVACLQRAEDRFHVVIDTLVHADAATVQNVERIVDELPDLQRCDDVERLHANAASEPEPAIAQRVDAVRAELTRAELLRDQGRSPLAETTARRAREDAAAIGHAPLEAEAATVLSGILLERQNRSEAESLAREAYTIAVRHELSEHAVQALDRLVAALRPDLARRTDAVFLSDVALALAARIDPGGRFEARALASRSRLLDTTGDYVEAIAAQRRALAIIEASADRNEREVARYAAALGNALYHGGEVVEAEQQLRRAIEIHERIGSPEQVLIGPKSTLSTALTDAGRLDEAEALKRWTLTASIIAYGPVHPKVAAAHGRLAALLQRRGDHDNARGHHLAALTVWAAGAERKGWEEMLGLAQISAVDNDFDLAWRWAELAREEVARELGDDHFDTTRPLGVLGILAAYRGDFATAIDYSRITLSRTEELYGSAHLESARARMGLADTMWVAGPTAPEIEQLYRTAFAVYARSLPQDDERTMFLRQNLADAIRLRGDFVEARAHLEVAWSVRSVIDISPTERGLTAFSLATVLAASPTDRARARVLGEIALELFLADDTAEARDYVAQTRAWLARGDDSNFVELAARGLDPRGL